MSFYIPSTKKGLVKWINEYYVNNKKTSAEIPALARKTKKQLYAIFFKLRREHDGT